MSTHGETHEHEHGHDPGRGHGHGPDVDWGSMADHLEEVGDLQLPALREIAARLRDRLGANHPVDRILDVGSGPGVMTAVFAETFPGAVAIAVDPSAGLIARARERAERLGLGDRVVARQGELPGGLAESVGTADIAWSSRAVHHVGDQQAALNELAATLRPGGLLAIVEDRLPMRFLPRDIGIGRPGLRSRIDLANDERFAGMRSGLPGSTAVIDDWMAMLRAAGLTEVSSFTTLLDLPPPLDERARRYLHSHLGHLRDTVGESLDAADREALDALLDRDSPTGILKRPDAFLLFPTTVFVGTRP